MKKALSFLFVVSLYGQNPVMTGPVVDISHAGHTLPTKVVDTLVHLPTTGCIPNEMAQVQSAPLSNQIYVNSTLGTCTWTQQGGSGGGGGLPYPGSPGIVFAISSLTTRVATSGDVISLFSGCSSATPLLSYTGACAAGGGSMGGSYVANTTGSPMVIPQTTHNQGANAITLCYTGPISSSAATGVLVDCKVQKDATGNVTVTYSNNSVGSIQILSSGSGPPGPVGPAGPAGPPGVPAPYVVNTSSSPQIIVATTHGQGINPFVFCWSGTLAGGATTGNYMPCSYSKNSSGDVTVYWSSGVGSIEVAAAGAGSGGGGGGGSFAAITNGTNTSAIMIVGSGASLTATGSGSIVATALVGFTPGAGTLTGPGSNLTLTASGGVMSNNTLGNAATSTMFAGTPTLCTTGNAPTGILPNGNATGCQPVGGSSGGTVTTSGTMTTTALVTWAGGTAIQTPNASTTLDTSGNMIHAGYSEAKGFVLNQNVTVTSPSNTFALVSGSIPSAYQWKMPSADAAGFITSNGAGNPGILAINTLSGDVTSSGYAVTLNTVNSTPGACGDSTHFSVPTINGKGLITTCSSYAVVASAGGSANQIQYNNGGALGGFTMNGDANINTSTGIIQVTGINHTILPAVITGNWINWATFATQQAGFTSNVNSFPSTGAFFYQTAVVSGVQGLVNIPTTANSNTNSLQGVGVIGQVANNTTGLAPNNFATGIGIVGYALSAAGSGPNTGNFQFNVGGNFLSSNCDGTVAHCPQSTTSGSLGYLGVFMEGVEVNIGPFQGSPSNTYYCTGVTHTGAPGDCAVGTIPNETEGVVVVGAGNAPVSGGKRSDAFTAGPMGVNMSPVVPFRTGLDLTPGCCDDTPPGAHPAVGTVSGVWSGAGVNIGYQKGNFYTATGATGSQHLVFQSYDGSVFRNWSQFIDSNNIMYFSPNSDTSGSTLGEIRFTDFLFNSILTVHVNQTGGGGRVFVSNMPTSCGSGNSGSLWNNGGVVNICP